MDAQDVLFLLITILIIILVLGVWGLNYAYQWYKRQPSIHSRILTCPQGVISYSFETKSLFDWLHRTEQADIINSKIQDVLQANPKADLKAFEKELNVTITNIDLKPPAPVVTSPPPPEYPRRPGFVGSDDQ